MVTGTNASASGSVTPKVACPTVPTAPLARSARSSVSDSGGMLRVQYDKLPWGIWVLEKLNLCRFHRSNCHKFLVLFLTFCCYASYHLSRKPTSVVKVSLCPKCGHCNLSDSVFADSAVFVGSGEYHHPNTSEHGWAPFNGDHGGTFLSILDYSWLFAYAITMYFSGFLSDRLNLRYFLTFGMLGSGIFTCLMGVAYYANIHMLYYFIIVQILGGAIQSTGWPSVVAIMSHWFGKNNRGLIMGIWNSHTSVGNILGTIIPSFWAECGEEGSWGLSFLIPGAIIAFFGVVTFLFLVPKPEHVGVLPPVHHTKEDLQGAKSPLNANSSSMIVSISKGDGHANGLLESDKDPLIVSHVAHVATSPEKDTKAINFLQALMIPGVVEFALSLFFDKLVSYTFLYWLPLYIKATNPGLTGPQSDWLSTVFDVGGILGGIIAGIISDRLNARAITCVSFLLLAVPFLFVFRQYGATTLWAQILLLIMCGLLVNGPYSIITTAVSSDLGTHPSLKSNQNAKATVTAIIDGTGSLGAAIGPLLVGPITNNNQNWNPAFYLLMSSCFVSALLLTRLVVNEIRRFKDRISIYLKEKENGYAQL